MPSPRFTISCRSVAAFALVPAGVYLARLAAGAHAEAVKLVLMP